MRRDRAKRGEQLFRVLVHRLDLGAAQQFGEKPHHRLAVLQHVGNAGGRAGIVFQHVELVGPRAHDIDARDVAINVFRRTDSRHFRPESGVREHQFLGMMPAFTASRGP